MVTCRKDSCFQVLRSVSRDQEEIDLAVFPGSQGEPHNHQIGALAVQLLEISTPECVGTRSKLFLQGFEGVRNMGGEVRISHNGAMTFLQGFVGVRNSGGDV